MWHFGPCVTFRPCQCHFLDLPMWLFGPEAVTCQWQSPVRNEILYRNRLKIKRGNKNPFQWHKWSKKYLDSRTTMFSLYPVHIVWEVLFTTFEKGTVRFQCTQPVAKACWSITTRDPIVYRADLRGIPKQFEFAALASCQQTDWWYFHC